MFAIQPHTETRVFLYTLRAVAANSDSMRTSEGLQIYMQSSLAAGGFLSHANSVASLARTLLVSSTIGTLMRPHVNLTPRHFGKLAPGSPSTVELRTTMGEDWSRDGNSEEVFEDYPSARRIVRCLCGLATVLFFGAILAAIAGGTAYKTAIESGGQAALVRLLWCALSSCSPHCPLSHTRRS